MWSQNPSFRFLYVYPKGCELADDHLSVFLRIAKPKSLPIGWKRNVSVYFIVLNHRNIEHCRSNILQGTFEAEHPGWGYEKLFPLSELKEEGFMGKDSLIIEVYINVIEAVDGDSEDVSEKETVDINGFQVSASHVDLVKKIFAEHPDIALGFKPKNQVVKRAYTTRNIGINSTR
ncbi:BnaC04g52790D [Brassica napus]|uniref:MATH domain-containing protein n=2 Tax=Brassica TaxID=3705 RepID=A0A0D3BPC6_BRAOL|nr:unnamed protein product [Brassica napus]CDY64624.1 BnaC04g52790D [Brassica napus]